MVTVHVIAEDESTLKGLSAKDFVLKIWLSKDSLASGKPPATVRFTCLCVGKLFSPSLTSDLFF